MMQLKASLKTSVDGIELTSLLTAFSETVAATLIIYDCQQSQTTH